MAELAQNPEVLRARVASVRAALAAAVGGSVGEVEWRVAASVTQLGLTARLLSPVLGVAALFHRVLDVDLARLRWQPEAGSAFPLSVQGGPSSGPVIAASDVPAGTELARLIAIAIVRGPVGALVQTLSSAYSLSPVVLWGNVASAVNGTACMLAASRPELSERAYGLASTVLSELPVRLLDPTPGPQFRRHSCCLIYRITPGRQSGICGDCVLQPDIGQGRRRR